MLQPQTAVIQDEEVTAKVLPFALSLNLQVRLGKDLSPILLSFFKEETKPLDFGEVIQKHINEELLNKIVTTIYNYVTIDGKPLNEKVMQGKGTVFFWEVCYLFLKTNYQDVLDHPKIQSLITTQK